VHNNPVNLDDPSGLASAIEGAVLRGVIVAVAAGATLTVAARYDADGAILGARAFSFFIESPGIPFFFKH